MAQSCRDPGFGNYVSATNSNGRQKLLDLARALQLRPFSADPFNEHAARGLGKNEIRENTAEHQRPYGRRHGH